MPNYYNDSNVKVNDRIEQGRTFLYLGTDIETRQLAEDKAREIGTYPYEMFADTEDGRRAFIGYGVPK